MRHGIFGMDVVLLLVDGKKMGPNNLIVNQPAGVTLKKYNLTSAPINVFVLTFLGDLFGPRQNRMIMTVGLSLDFVGTQ